MTKNGSFSGAVSRIIVNKNFHLSFPSQTSKRVMSTVFYCFISQNTKRITLTNPSFQRYAVSEENTFVCRQLESNTKDPQLLLMQQGNKQCILELTTRQETYGDYSFLRVLVSICQSYTNYQRNYRQQKTKTDLFTQKKI